MITLKDQKVVVSKDSLLGAEEAAAEITQEGGTASAFQVNVSNPAGV